MAMLVFFGIILTLVPLLAYVGVRDAHAAAWAPRALPQTHHAHVAAGPFRAANVSAVSWRWTRGGVPWSVAIAAITCYGFGQMLVPGALLACGGMLFALGEGAVMVGLLALTAIPGVYAAAQVWGCGTVMLSNDVPRARAQIERAVRVTVCLNLPLLAFALVAVAVKAKCYPVFYGTLLYAPLSLLHAFMVYAVWAAHAARAERLEQATAELATLGLDPAPLAG